MSQLGKTIQLFREAAGLTQDELGERIGVSQQTIAKWEGGKSNPRPKALARLIDVLRIDGRKLREMRASSTIDTLPYLPTELLAEKMLNDPEINPLDEIRNESSKEQSPMEISNTLGFDSVRNATELQEMIRPFVEAAEPTSQWDVVLRSQTGPWRVDYVNDELYAQFLHTKTPIGLSMLLWNHVYRTLWRFAMLGRDPQSNKKYHVVIIAYPEGQPIDKQEDRKDPGMPRRSFSNENALRRLTTEASLMGIHILLARTPSKVVSLLTNPSSVDDSAWDYYDPDEEIAAD